VTDYYGYDPNNKLRWVNQGTNAPSTSGQTPPYTWLYYDVNGRVTTRDRRLTGAASNRIFAFSWDADDRLRAVREGTLDRFLAKYGEDGLRRWKSEGWALPTNPATINEYTWGAGGLLHSSNPNTVYMPGIGRRSNGVYLYFHGDWLGSTRYTSRAEGVVTEGLRYDGFGNRTLLGHLDPNNPANPPWPDADQSGLSGVLEASSERRSLKASTSVCSSSVRSCSSRVRAASRRTRAFR
jgi:hypothetical protein